MLKVRRLKRSNTPITATPMLAMGFDDEDEDLVDGLLREKYINRQRKAMNTLKKVRLYDD